MPIIDERGRLFGRMNLVDGAVAVVIAILLPAAYGAYLLFKEPAPILKGVAPNRLRQGPNLQVEVQGENLRPYMRVSFNDVQGRSFLFNNPRSAIVQLADMPVGKYDVVLYDYMQEVARIKDGFALEAQPAPPQVIVGVAGVLTGLTPEQAQKIQAGQKFPEQGQWFAEVVEIGAAQPEVLRIRIGDKSTLTLPVDGPVQLPVRLRTHCNIETTSDGGIRCSVAGVPLAPDANVQYPWLGTALNFRVSEVHYPGRSRTATVQARFVISPEARLKLKPSDRDLGARAHPAGQMATLMSFTDRGEASPAMVRDDRVRQAIPTSRLIVVDAILQVPVEDTPLGWTYKGALVKVGAPISFETAAYTMDGGVVDLTVAEPDRVPGTEPTTSK